MLPLLTDEGRHRIWTRWTKELPRALPFGEEVLSELPASYRLEDGTLYLHLHLPLFDQAYHLYNLQDFPVFGPLGKPVYLRSTDTDTLAVSDDARMRSWIRRTCGGALPSGIPTSVCCLMQGGILPLCAS